MAEPAQREVRRRFWLAPLGAGMFHPVQLDEDELFDVVTNLVYEFTPLEG